MRAFADLLDSLIYTRSRNAKLRRIGDYLRAAPDPDRGWAMAALTGGLDLPAVKPALIRALVEARVDPVLFALSRDFVGDTAETVALLWPAPEDGAGEPLALSAVVDTLAGLSRSDAPRRAGGDARPARRERALRLAQARHRRAARRHFRETRQDRARAGLQARRRGRRGGVARARPALCAAVRLGPGARGPADRRGCARLPPLHARASARGRRGQPRRLCAEWKWDGIRAQLVHVAGETRLYSRAGDDITHSFPEVATAFATPGVLDGELLVRGEAQGGAAGSFNALQQRLGRKVVPARTLAEYPAFVRLYDILFDGAEDLRALPWVQRRVRLEAFAARLDPERFDVSALIPAADFAALEELRAGARDAAIEGVMLKRRDSPYVAGRRTGLWYKWKRDPLTADCVLMYAQRGSGKRSSFYSDYTFGAWTEAGELLPVGKAYFGFTDEELKWLDHFVRNHTINRFGPVREVEKRLVLEVAFDSIHESKRHKSGLAMRFPRISRIRTDKPAAEADTIAGLTRLIS
ncbi:MAG: cisplatin damage response ATP-dependent DNA ligase [Sphingomonas sp.]